MLDYRHILFVGFEFTILPLLVLRNGYVDYSVLVLGFNLALLFLPSYSKFFYRTGKHKALVFTGLLIICSLAYWLFLVDGKAWRDKEVSDLFITQDLVLIFPCVFVWFVIFHSIRTGNIKFREDLE